MSKEYRKKVATDYWLVHVYTTEIVRAFYMSKKGQFNTLLAVHIRKGSF